MQTDLSRKPNSKKINPRTDAKKLFKSSRSLGIDQIIEQAPVTGDSNGELYPQTTKIQIRGLLAAVAAFAVIAGIIYFV